MKLEASGVVLKEKLSSTGPTGCSQCHPRQ
jgi:hypothetical protein